jgi:hypothetical protein
MTAPHAGWPQEPTSIPPPPEVTGAVYRKQLFLPQLERLLQDPDDLPLDDSADSIRVRIDQAIESIERRSAEAAAEAARRATVYRFTVCLSAVFGACALIVGLAFPDYLTLCLVIALGEAVTLVVFARRMRAAAADCAELTRLGGRYRPALDAAEETPALRALAAQIRAEMDELTIDPRPAEAGA